MTVERKPSKSRRLVRWLFSVSPLPAPTADLNKGKGFSIVRVLGMLIMLGGLPLLCIFFPLGLGLLIVGAVFVITGE